MAICSVEAKNLILKMAEWLQVNTLGFLIHGFGAGRRSPIVWVWAAPVKAHAVGLADVLVSGIRAAIPDAMAARGAERGCNCDAMLLQ